VTELIVTMDGPGGTGKSTVSREVASRLGLPHLDTGAFYRAAGLIALRAGVDVEDGDQVLAAIAEKTLDQRDGRMFVDGIDISEEIRSPAATAASSRVSAHPAVRNRLVSEQRGWVNRHDNRAVVEGRDIGSVVFPDATLKIYLDAHPEVRARRRSDQTGEGFDGVLAELDERDGRDKTRSASPLTIPHGAVVIDTSEMSFEAVVDRVVNLAAGPTG
jgi:cytidylate kinase